MEYWITEEQLNDFNIFACLWQVTAELAKLKTEVSLLINEISNGTFINVR